MGLKIAFMYLDISNLGDLVIYETARYIVEDILKKNNIENYEIIPVDIGSYKYRSMNNYLRVKRRVLTSLLGHVEKNSFFSHCFPKASKEVMTKLWHLTPPYTNYMKYEKPKLEGVDIIVFGGGGLIKFHRQNFHYYIDDITNYAQKRNIPVLLNAQGIEGYDEKNLGCQLLKTALNRNCVKYISTRDDLPMLCNCYITNPHIVVKNVCDPAFWVSETYQIPKSNIESKKVGINVIRPKIFGEYMYKVSNESLGRLYYELIQKLHDSGYLVELFSNGVEKDSEFLDWLLKRYPDLYEDDRVTVAKPVSTKEFVQLLAGYERFMAVRLHAAIIGTVLGIPNVSLVWNRKQILFGEQTGLSQNFITKEKFNVEKIFRCLCEAKPYKMNETYKSSVYQNLEEQLIKWVKV